jgi:hypothetical protein
VIHDEADRSNVRLISVYFGFVQLLCSSTDDRRNLKITAEIRFTPALLGFFVGVQSSRNPKECGCWPGSAGHRSSLRNAPVMPASWG